MQVPKGQKHGRMRPKERKDKAHCDYVASRGCCICGRPAEIHHLMHVDWRKKIGRKDDRWSIPLCPEHHLTTLDSVHMAGDEKGFLESYGVDGEDLATRLWEESHA